MYKLTQTFSHQSGFQLTPIYMENLGYIFFPKEFENQLGYKDLSSTIRLSESFEEGVEYLVLRSDKLLQLKKFLKRSNGVPFLQLKQANASIVLTESGLYTSMILSRKPNALPFRRWVTGEVLPSIQKTGMYQIFARTSSDQMIADQNVSVLLNKIDSLEKKLSQIFTEQFQFQEYALRGFDRIEAVLTDSLPHDIFEGWKKIKTLISDMSDIYQLTDLEKKQYLRELCQAHDVILPEKALCDHRSNFFDTQELAEKIGVYSSTGKVHSRLVLALIQYLKLNQKKYIQKIPVSRRGYNTNINKYSDNVIPHIIKFLHEKNYPEQIHLTWENKNRKFRVKYRSQIGK